MSPSGRFVPPPRTAICLGPMYCSEPIRALDNTLAERRGRQCVKLMSRRELDASRWSTGRPVWASLAGASYRLNTLRPGCSYYARRALPAKRAIGRPRRTTAR